MIHISPSEQSRWAYFSDQVMGGISEGRVVFEQVDNQSVLRLTGMVSTANRGGFFQARTKLDAPLAVSAQGVILRVRGNNQTYFVHLRTKWTILPWQFYQASFEASDTWEEVRIPFDDFEPHGRLLATAFDVGTVQSLAIAAFGRYHNADFEDMIDERCDKSGASKFRRSYQFGPNSYPGNQQAPLRAGLACNTVSIDRFTLRRR